MPTDGPANWATSFTSGSFIAPAASAGSARRRGALHVLRRELHRPVVVVVVGRGGGLRRLRLRRRRRHGSSAASPPPPARRPRRRRPRRRSRSPRRTSAVTVVRVARRDREHRLQVEVVLLAHLRQPRRRDQLDAHAVAGPPQPHLGGRDFGGAGPALLGRRGGGEQRERHQAHRCSSPRRSRRELDEAASLPRAAAVTRDSRSHSPCEPSGDNACSLPPARRPSGVGGPLLCARRAV